MLFTCFFRELMNILGIMGLIFCIFLPVQHRAQVLFHYYEASFKRSEWRTFKKKTPHIFTDNHMALINTIPLQQMCKVRLSPTEVILIFSQYSLYIKMSINYVLHWITDNYVLLNTDNHSVQKLNLEKSWAFDSPQDHHLVSAFFWYWSQLMCKVQPLCHTANFFPYCLRIIK